MLARSDEFIFNCKKTCTFLVLSNEVDEPAQGKNRYDKLKYIHK